MASYLLQGRFGVWYFRMRLPISSHHPRKAPRHELSPGPTPRRREIRLSLRTKNKEGAKLLALKHWISMQEQFAYPQPYEAEELSHDQAITGCLCLGSLQVQGKPNYANYTKTIFISI